MKIINHAKFDIFTLPTRGELEQFSAGELSRLQDLIGETLRFFVEGNSEQRLKNILAAFGETKYTKSNNSYLFYQAGSFEIRQDYNGDCLIKVNGKTVYEDFEGKRGLQGAFWHEFDAIYQDALAVIAEQNRLAEIERKESLINEILGNEAKTEAEEIIFTEPFVSAA